MPQVLSQMVNVEDLRLGRNQIASLMSNQTMKMTLADGREKEVVVESFKQLLFQVAGQLIHRIDGQ